MVENGRKLMRISSENAKVALHYNEYYFGSTCFFVCLCDYSAETSLEMCYSNWNSW